MVSSSAMPAPNVEPFTSSNQRIRRSNVSLPERATPLEALPTTSRRNTITEGNGSKVRKKVKAPVTPSIPEYEVTDDKSISFTVEKETKGVSRKTSDASRLSAASSRSKISHSFDNKAFDGKEGNLIRNESANNSIRTDSRAPSVRSLEIYREQYCCCARRSKCEKSLLVTVTVLIIIIIVLVIVIAVLASNKQLHQLFSVANR
ncbi:uncharacterized protein LOC125503638 isoform X1 [Dendroctonus ponderosae]|uniref:LEM domain-containing protein n=2 Tax=Dendroctonus ponderosae TaxID=77166 RepID=A0AAR5P5E3_DENPD|nr:uncharacterized protein LOC109534525 isoform X1 [Dendroctonus ponderosae]XP_048520311.1 uncharacterized protein LOC125503638 isoform X1 [Dendroctonus ponderosae]